MLRRSLRSISDPLSRALLRSVDVRDAWQRIKAEVPTSLFGLGAFHEFSWYLSGESHVDVSSIDDILDWLSGCRYTSDPELFRETDFWQHPCTFERLREGDCEDFALWAWRKLTELGAEAEFVAGRCRTSPGAANEGEWSTGHAWVHFTDGDQTFLLDAVCTESPIVARPLKTVRENFLPEVSVDGFLNRYVYGGYYLLRREK